MGITIDKGVPIPARGRLQGRYAEIRGVLGQLDVGDSFLLLIGNGQKLTSQRAAVGKLAREVGIRITTRDEGAQLRVWRVSETDTESGGNS